MPSKKTEVSEAVEQAVPEELQEPAAEAEVLPPGSETVEETVTEPVEEVDAVDPAPDESPPKARRFRRKQEDAEIPAPDPPAEMENEEPEPEVPEEENEEVSNPEPAPAPRRSRPRQEPILTVEAGADVETEESLADLAWHEIHNAYRTRRILTGTLGGIEQNEAGKTLAILEYKGYRIVIPLKEMVMDLPNNLSGREYSDMITRQHKLLSNMLGAEIDFIVRGIDSKTRSVVASRREAMMKKRKTFYMDTDEAGAYRIYDGRIVQARVIAVAEKTIRIETFGVECSIMARDLSWDWIGDAHERFSVGDHVLVRILDVKRDSIEELAIKADVKSVSENRQSNLHLCRIQGKYAGKVTDVHKGVVFIRLTNGVNAIAHSCYDRRMPGKKDDVSFAVTHIDEERGVAVGIITRIIKQNL